MQCLNPILSNTTVHGRIWLPCGKCLPCKQRKGRDWFIRLKKHYEAQKLPSYFVTLTYSDENLPMFVNEDTGEIMNGFDKKTVQDFIKNIRNFTARGIPKGFDIKNPVMFSKNENYKMSYFCIAERGDLFGRPHYHILFYNIPWNKETFDNIIRSTWSNGLTDVGEVNDKSTCYVTDYMVTKDETTEWRIMSKNLGSDFVEKHGGSMKKTMEFKVTIHDKKYNMPRYYRDRIFTAGERKAISKRIEAELINPLPNSVAEFNEVCYKEMEERQNKLTELIRRTEYKKQKRRAQKFNKYNSRKNEK